MLATPVMIQSISIGETTHGRVNVKGDSVACSACGHEFIVRHGNQKSCSAVCRKKMNVKSAVEVRRLKKYGHRHPRVIRIECEECGLEVETLQPKQKICCASECIRTRDLRLESKHREHKRQSNPPRQRPSFTIQRLSVVSSARTRYIFTGQCLFCSSPFSTIYENQKHCSIRCRNRNSSRRANQGQSKKEWELKNKERLRAQLRARDNHLRATDPAYRLRQTVRCLVKASYKFRRLNGISGVWTHLGYSPVQLRAHIESFFTKENGFTWENHGKLWQLDHVKPQSWFSFTSPQCEGFKQCWMLSNLRPEFKDFNKKKSNRFAGSSDGMLVSWRRG